MTTYLVALDGSEASLRALAQARNEAAKLDGAKLHLLTVHVPWQQSGASATDLQRIARLAQVYHEWVMGQARVFLEPDGPAYTGESVEGDPGALIVARAAGLGCAAIFLGSQGMGFSRGRPGSTAVRVRELSQVPVHVID